MPRTDAELLDFLQNDASWCLDKADDDVILEMYDERPMNMARTIREVINRAMDREAADG